MATREYAGAAKRTAITGDITAASTTITVTDATGYPTGATGPFAIALELGAAAEEKVLVASRSGNTLTVDTRGYDGTTAAAHSSGATVDHVLTAIDIREANTHINKAANAHDATAISFTAAAGITATSVQAAIEEVVSDASAAYVEKAAVTSARVDASQTTTSTAWADLATVGPVVPVTIGASGRALVVLSSDLTAPTGGAASMSFAVSGATTRAVQGGVETITNSLSSLLRVSRVCLVTGLTPGANTFTAKYASSNGNSMAFGLRDLVVIPL